MQKNYYFTFLLSILVLFATAAKTPNTHPQVQQKRIWAKSFLGQKAPAIQVEEWITEPNLSEGKYIMIDFWATWCGPCRRIIPELNAWQEEFKDKLVIIGISDEAREKVEPFARKNIQYACGYDTQAKLKKTIKVSGIPHIIIINPQGIVVWEGYPKLKKYELTTEVLKQLLK